MKRRQRNWYAVTQAVAERLAAKGCPIKPKPSCRVSGVNGAWMVLCHPSLLWEVAREAQAEKIAT